MAKSLIVSQLVYLMAAISIDRKSLDLIQSHIMKFLWRGRPPKVAKSTLYQDIEHGGLKCPDVSALHRAHRIAWLGRMCKYRDLAFAKVFQARLRISMDDVARMNYDKRWIDLKPVSTFYKDMLKWFRDTVPCKEPSEGKQVRCQIMWNNVAIATQGALLSCQAAYNNDIRFIDDFLDRRGRWLSYESFKIKFPALRIDPLTYIRWARAVPMEWKRMVEHSLPMQPDERNGPGRIEINGRLVPIELVKTKFYYWHYISDCTPTAERRWQEQGIDFGDNWGNIYSIPFSVTSSTRLQSLQYRILHRFFPTRRYLCIRKVVQDPFCNDCGEIDAIQHFLIHCHEVRRFWDNLVGLINDKLPERHRLNLTDNTVIFGSLTAKKIVNFLILLAKQYIVIQRAQECNVSLTGFRIFLQKMFLMERCIAVKRQKMELLLERWKYFVTISGNFDL